MSGDGSTTTGSEGDQTPAGTPDGAGAADDGARGEQNSEALRNLQAQRDRQTAEIAKLKADLAAASATPAAEPTQTQPESLTAEGVMALLKRDREMTGAVSQLRTDFPFADDAIFTGYERFETVEAFRAEAETSHSRIKGLADKAAQPLVDAALAPYIEKYGQLAATPPDNGGGQVTGLPSPEEVRNYTATQLEQLVAQHGEDVIERIWRSSLTQS